MAERVVVFVIVALAGVGVWVLVAWLNELQDQVALLRGERERLREANARLSHALVEERKRAEKAERKENGSG